MISKETLIQKLELEDVPNANKIKILEKAADIVLDKTLLRLMNELEEEESVQINELLNNNEQDKVAMYLYEKFPNINDIFDEEIEKIKKN